MRKPNGYGSVYKLSGNRRKPWTAMVTKAFVLQDGRAVQKRTAIGYYASQKDAEIALAKYNENPYDTDVTFEQVYNGYTRQKFEKIVDGTKANYDSIYKKFSPLYHKKFSKLRVAELESVIMSCKSQSQRQQMHSMLNQMYKYALKYEIANHNLADRFSVEAPKTKIERKPFTDEEIKMLWESDDLYAKVTLILIYTGMRVSELQVAEIHDGFLKGGLKTESGRDRVIPIREKIKPLMSVLESVRGISQKKYYNEALNYMKSLGHTTHDCRVTFSTRYKDANPVLRKLIMGHKLDDITERVYTKHSLDELKEFIESVDF